VALQGNTTGLNVAMESGRAITGTVTVGPTAVGGAWVNAWSETLATGGGAVTDAAGKYAIKGLPAGTYRVDVWTTEGTVGDTVTLTEGADQVKDLSVVKSLGIIRGKVTSDGTTASVKALVLAYDGSDVERDRAVSDANGDYKLEGLEPNQSYTLKVFGATNGNWSTTGSGYAASCAVTSTTDGATPVALVLGSVCVP
ncbi:MAG: carboxypeptidase regulatory-like domain-containing protein, partial [Magnetococcales bacterium]|nr:carboxypeptidase regulatory-like domain-containing protein [Magnetococcales bacterium]